MKITHVLRGDDHISNTPKQIALYRAMGAELPVFGHVPMINGPDGKKLSKRHGATAIGDYQKLGILPLAMRNFLALLGWSPGGDREILPEAEMISLFSLEGIQKKPAVFDLTKLEWMNGQYLSARPAEELLEPVRGHLAEMGVETRGRDLRPLIDSVKARSRTLLDIANQVAVRLSDAYIQPDGKAKQFMSKMGDENFKRNLNLAREALVNIPTSSWDSSTTLGSIQDLAKSQNAKLGDIMQPIRIAVTGSTVSEPVNELLGVVGRETAIKKIDTFLSHPSTSAWKP